MRSRSVARGLVSLVCLAATSSHAAPELVLDDYDELLLDLWLEESSFVSDDLYGFSPAPREIVVPFKLLTDHLGIPFVVDAAQGTAEGVLPGDTGTLVLKTHSREVTLDGTLLPYPDGKIFVLDDEILIDVRVLSEWFPMIVLFDALGSRIQVFPDADTPLPMQERWEREERFRLISRTRFQPPVYPSKDHPYRAWSLPFVDLSAATSVTRAAGGAPLHTANQSMMLTGDLFYMSGILRTETLGGRPWGNVDFVLERRDESAGLLGPLRARHLLLGDTSLETAALIRPATPLRGLVVSNFPVHELTQYSSRDFVGDLPEGWEVELYRNHTLVDYAASDETGRYEFVGTPLEYGLNRFELRFYGPQGQHEVESHRFNVGQDIARPGRHYYRVGIGQDPEGATVAEALYKHTLFNVMSAELSFHRMLRPELGSLSEEDAAFGTFGLHGFWKAWYASTVHAFSASGYGLDAQIQARFGLWDVWFRNVALNHFQSRFFEQERSGSIQEFRMQGQLGSGRFLSKLPMSLWLQRDGSKTLFTQRTSYSQVRTALTHEIRFAFDDEEETAGGGRWLVRFPYKRWRSFFSGDYSVAPITRLARLSLEASKTLDSGYSVTPGFAFNFRENLAAISVKSHREFGRLRAAAGLEMGHRGRVEFTFSLTSSFLPTPQSGWDLQAKPRASSGAASVVAFLDTNNNGTFDAEETPIEDVHFAVEGHPLALGTEDDGSALLDKLTAYREVNLEVSLQGIDPYWKPSQEGFRFVPRPGAVVRAEFPFVITGEVDGTITLSRDGSTRPASGVLVQLLDKEGVVVQETKSAFDGFYLFEGILPGEYTTRIDPEQLKRGGYEAPPATRVVIQAEGSVQSGVDFLIEPTEPEVAPLDADEDTGQDR